MPPSTVFVMFCEAKGLAKGALTLPSEHEWGTEVKISLHLCGTPKYKKMIADVAGQERSEYSNSVQTLKISPAGCVVSVALVAVLFHECLTLYACNMKV